jgi:serine/threonine-protein kinase
MVLVLLLGGIGAGAGIGFGLWGQRQSNDLRDSAPEWRGNNPQTFPPAEFPESEDNPIPEPEENPAPESEPSEGSVEPSSEPPEVATEPHPKPEPPPVSPTPTPQPPAPQPPPEQKPSNVTRVPIFVTGTSENQILTALGEPSSQNKGYWPNTKAWLYKDYVANQVDLGYIFDANTGRLRQTEVSFAQSVSLEVMQNTLNGLLGGNTPAAIAEGLAEVYNRQNDLRSFSLENVKGMIHRNNKDRVYIAIWEADFH